MPHDGTPGPWHVNRKRPTLVNGPEEAPGVIVDCESVQYTEAIANARLIAAAPDLLAACRQFLALPPLERSCIDLEIMIEAAVTKATGTTTTNP